MNGPIEEQPSLWQQSDLLSLVSATPALSPAPQPKQVVVRDPSPSNCDPQSRSALINLLILDTETTGLEPVSAQCIEVGAVLFHVPSRSVLSQVSFLLPAPANPAEHVNGIAAEVTRLSQPWQAGLQHFLALLAGADAVLAHNAAFDAKWFGLGPLPAIDKPWICSMDDIEWPPERHLRTSPSVRDLALAYGVPVWAAHRALTDCTYLVQVLERCANLEDLLAAATEPKLLYRANLPYAERHKAKQAGFRWNEPVRGAWSRRLSERQALALAFEVQRVEADSQVA